MKTVVCLLSMLMLFSCAHSEPSDVDISYLYYQNGNYVVSVKNLSTCNTGVRISWRKGNQDTLVSVGQLQTVIVHLPAAYDAGLEIKAKSEGTCPNNGWTRLIVPLSLDVKVNAFNAFRKGSSVVISYDVSFTETGDYTVIEKCLSYNQWMPIEKILTPGHRSYTDSETEICYYRLHNRSAGGGESYSKVVAVGASYNTAQLAGVIQVFSDDGRYLGVFSRWQDLPRNQRLTLSDGTRSRSIAVVN